MTARRNFLLVERASVNADSYLPTSPHLPTTAIYSSWAFGLATCLQYATMDPFNDTSVQVILDDSVLRLYNVTTFRIKLMLNEVLYIGCLGNEDAIQISINFDGSDPSWTQHKSKTILEHSSLRGVSNDAFCLLFFRASFSPFFHGHLKQK